MCDEGTVGCCSIEKLVVRRGAGLWTGGLTCMRFADSLCLSRIPFTAVGRATDSAGAVSV